ncbi:MAG: hypothetical protein JSV39_01060 [Candidatus Aenigmatarchaeota archaeon]|nr:MAG: hypothetical protein JSV39_01060 [Candidatus Aenigmarchaeota archaeon]
MSIPFEVKNVLLQIFSIFLYFFKKIKISFEKFLSNFEKKDYISLLIITIYILAFLKPVVSGDGFGYYAIMEGIFRYQTLNLTNELRFNEISPNEGLILFYNETGIYSSYHFPVIAIISAPVYMTSLFLSNFEIFHIKDEFFIRERGDILINQASIPITSIIFLYAGLFATLFFLKKYYSKKYAWLALLLVFFSTSLIRYAVYDLSYTHALEAGLMGILILLFLRDSNKIYMGILLGMLTMLHYNSAIFILPFLIYYLYQKRKEDVLKIIIGLLPFAVIIMTYNTLVFGGPFSIGYGEYLESPETSIFPIHFFQLIFDLDRGILWWTPAIIISTFGLLLVKDRGKKYLFISLILLNVYFMSSFQCWDGAWGFGNRFFAMFFPIYCIGTVKILEEIPKYRHILYFSAIYTVLIYFMFLAYTPTPLSILPIWANFLSPEHLINLPALIFTKIGIVRFLLEIGPCVGMECLKFLT